MSVVTLLRSALSHNRTTSKAVIIAACAFAACSSDKTLSLPATPAAPAQLTISSGNTQTAQILASVPQNLVVEVLDSAGKPDPGVTVTFATTSNGSIGAFVVATDAQGLAKTAFIMGSTTGTESVTATVAGVVGTVEFDLTATPMAPATIGILSGGGQTAAAGSVLAAPIVAQVTDVYGNGVPGATVTWSTTVGSITASTTVTDANGKVTATVQLPATPGAVEVTATLPVVSGAVSTVIVTGT